MVYDWNDFETHPTGRTLPDKVVDAAGQEYQYVTWCDTETGEIRMHVHDNDGNCQMTQNGTDILTKQIMAPAPLKVEWDE